MQASENAQFCGNCGTVVQQLQQSQPTKTLQPLQQQPVPQWQPTQPQYGQQHYPQQDYSGEGGEKAGQPTLVKTMLICIAALVVLVSAAVLIVFLVVNSGNTTIQEIIVISQSTPEPTSEPTPVPADDDLTGTELPSGGGTVRADEPKEFTFSPDREGIWVIYTTDNGSNKPYLEVFKPNGEILRKNNNSELENHNALLNVYLFRDNLYTVKLSFIDVDEGSASIVVVPPERIPPDGGEFTVTLSQGYMLSPEQAGLWEFRTSNSGNHDPYLIINDEYSADVVADDDNSGEGYNALISVRIPADIVFHITAGFNGIGPVEYTFTVSRVE